MTETEFADLQPGDRVRHASGGAVYIVTGNYGDHVTVVRTVDMANPSEWMRVEPIRGRP